MCNECARIQSDLETARLELSQYKHRFEELKKIVDTGKKMLLIDTDSAEWHRYAVKVKNDDCRN